MSWEKSLPKSINLAYRRTKKLIKILATSILKANQQSQAANNSSKELGSFKCNGRCDLCKKFLMESDRFWSYATGRSYIIKEKVSCTSANVTYLISCTRCNLQYVGSTSNQLKVRFWNHKSAMKTKKTTCETVIHFNHLVHEFSDFKVIYIEKINFSQTVQRLLKREAYWTAQLRTFHSDGLNNGRKCHLGIGLTTVHKRGNF